MEKLQAEVTHVHEDRNAAEARAAAAQADVAGLTDEVCALNESQTERLQKVPLTEPNVMYQLF